MRLFAKSEEFDEPRRYLSASGGIQEAERGVASEPGEFALEIGKELENASNVGVGFEVFGNNRDLDGRS